MKFLFFFVGSIALWRSINSQYTAAVVEYGPLKGTSPNKTVEINLDEYIHYIETARASAVDIIVFPEYGLTGLFEHASDTPKFAIEIPPFNNGTTFENYWLQRLSNAASEHRMYVVVNLLEKATDGSGKINIYNTNVVFDKKGNLITKYRKINLIDEDGLTPGNETVTFETDFGVTFGIFTCFDIQYYHPSQTVLLNTSIKDIVYPTAWIATFPFYHSISTQYGYVQANGVNFLAGGLNNPASFSTGSGIYLQDGTVEGLYLSGQSSSKMIIRRIQKPGTVRTGVDDENPFITHGFGILNDTNSDPTTISNFPIKYLMEQAELKTKMLNLSSENISETLCEGDFCCSASITTSRAEINASEIYQLVVSNGPAKTFDIPAKLQLCAILACETRDLQTCGTTKPTLKSKFRQVSISAEFDNGPGYFFRPTSINKDLLPILNSTFTSEVKNNSALLTYSTQHAEDSLLTFAIISRFKSGATSVYSTLTLIVVLMLNFLRSIF